MLAWRGNLFGRWRVGASNQIEAITLIDSHRHLGATGDWFHLPRYRGCDSELLTHHLTAVQRQIESFSEFNRRREIYVEGPRTARSRNAAPEHTIPATEAGSYPWGQGDINNSAAEDFFTIIKDH